MNDTLNLYGSIIGDSLAGFIKLFQIHRVTLLDKQKEGDDIVSFVFESKGKISYDAGQYGIWFMPKFMWGKPVRLFTVAAPPQQGTVQISTRISQSKFKQNMNNMSTGDHLWLFGPIGRFTIAPKHPKEVVLLAGGIGITPMRSIILDIANKKLKIKTHLIHSSRGIYLFKNELKTQATTASYTTKVNYVDTLTKKIKEVGNDTVFYISGPPGFVYATEKILKQNGVTNIKKDGFLGY